MHEEKLKKFMREHGVVAEHFHFEASCHSVDEAARAANADRTDFVKNICLIDSTNNLIVAIVNGDDRVSTTRVGEALSVERPRQATPEEILEKTGYPCGGTPSFGYAATFLVDDRVMEKENVYTGGGSENSLVKIAPNELVKANGAQVVRIRK